METEWTRLPEADRTINWAVTSGAFADHARDHMIARHVRGDRVPVTSNLRDFRFLSTVVNPNETMGRFSRGRAEAKGLGSATAQPMK